MTSSRHIAHIFRSLNCDGFYGWGLLATLGLLLAPLAGGEPLRLHWRYEREAVAAGQWWRLASAHFTHMDMGHALLNCTGLVLLWALFARSYHVLQWLVVLTLTMLVIDAGFWFISTTLHWYVGASALLHGVFACGCVAMIRQRDRLGYVAAVCLIAKLVWEQVHGPLPLETRHPVVTVSHAYGAMGGALAGLLFKPRSRLY